MPELSSHMLNLSSKRRQLLKLMLQDAGEAPKKETISRRAGSDPAPASFAQRRMWFLDQLEPGNPFYNLPGAVRLRGQTNRQALKQAVTEIVNRHEVLRTSFPSHKGMPMQVIASSFEIEMPLTDLRNLPADEREQQMNALAAAEAQKPFDLAHGPLLRVSLVQLDDEDHVFLLTLHHIVSDGWSIGIFIEELASLYDAFSSGKSSSLSQLPVQYSDYTIWQREWLQGEVLEQQIGYWREQLAELPVLEMPTDHTRPAVQSYNGSHHYFCVPQEVTQQLKDISQQEGATLFMVLLAAFQLLLSRYSGQEDIVVGTAIAGRNRAETEKLIGCFVNTLVLRTDLSGGPTFQELVKRVREVSLGAYAHQDVPFEKLVEELHPERDLSRSPLFQTMFILQNTPRDMLQLAGLTLSSQQTVGTTAKLDLLLSVVEGESGLVGDLEYNTDLFATATVERMCRHFETLLTGVAVEPQQKIARVPMLSAGEQEQILVEWNQTAVEYGPASCVHELFEQQVARNAAALALTYAGESLSYGELNERANQVAHYLRARGVRPEVPVAVYLPRSIEMVVALLGILKAGGAYVPLDVEYPVERVTFMIADAGVKLLLTGSAQLEQLPDMGEIEVISLDHASEAIGSESVANVASGVSADNLAYVIYTSGSTGRPKGVMIRHGSVGNMLTGLYAALELGRDEVWTMCHSYAFDFSVWELWGALLSGARLVLIPAGMTRMPQKLRAELQEQRVTVLSLTPSAMGQLLRASEEEQWDAASGWSLQRVVVGGEALSQELRAEVVRRGVAAWNFYGPTEATVWTTIERLEESGNEGGIGRPIGNYAVYVLNRELEPVAVGVSGELYIGGAGLARAYLNRPELTAERFIPHPYSRTEGARLYCTGDVARYLADGRIEYVGRADEQVKVRGYRIELGEIEAVLERQAGVAECVVVVRGEGAEKRLVAYVVAEAGVSLSVSELRTRMGEQLPGYMVPAAFVMLESLPLTKNGKVDRRALPEPEATERSEDYVAPRTATEEIVAGIWQSVLRVERVGINDNFFELGGHSLLATQLVSRLREVFAVEIALRSLFEHPTVAGLAEVVTQSDELSAPPIVARERTEALPLSFAQQRLWFLDQLEPNSAFYNIPAAVRLSGRLNLEALERTFTEIVRRHEALRTGFITVDGEARQQIAEPATFKLPVIDLTTMPEELRNAEAEGLARAEAATPFDLSAGELLRVKVLRVAAEEHMVLLTMHHIISDGWSLGVLIKEVGTLYAAYSEGKESPLEELSIQYGDYARWQREWLQGEVLEQQMQYWREQLAELPVLELPTDHVRPAVQSYKGSHHHFTIPPEVTQRLKDLSQQEGATLFMVLLAGFQLLLSRYSGQEDIVVGTPIAGRNRSETEQLIGFFVNTLVMRTRVEGKEDFTELLKRAREVALGAYAHQDMPFEKLVEELQPERNLSHSPLFQVMFILQNAPMGELELPGLQVSHVADEAEVAKFDLMLSLDESAAGIQGRWVYNTDLFDASTIERMSGHFQTLLAGIVTNPQQALCDLPLLTGTERQLLLEDWNETSVADPQALCLHQLIEAQVARTPEAVALTFADARLTYSELNERANQLAHYLRASGVGPEVVVGICVERSVEMVVGLLGILKAGGAYLPIDPSYPPERIEFMLQDARISLLLTQSKLVQRLSLAGEQRTTFCLDDNWAQLATLPTTNLSNNIKPENLAYVIYTSGSTGRPKGSMLHHRGICNRLLWMQHAYRLGADDAVLQKTSFSFDVSVWEFFWPLLSGARLVVAQPDGHRDNAYLVDVIRRERITVLHFVPSMLQAWIEAEGVENCESLRVVVCSGEALSAELQRRFEERLSWVELENLYGPTEASVDVTRWSCRGQKVDAVPIGRTIWNTQMYVLGKEFELLPLGVTGELYIGGVQLARGYARRPELTAERFIPHPYSVTGGERLYRTGDLARYLADGAIEYLGRTDDQVKIRGFRIELGEVEIELARHESVREVVVVARESVGGSKLLVAYIVSNGTKAPATVLRQHLLQRLPEWMVPNQFVELETWPLTPNGKLDRKALPAPDGMRPEMEHLYVSPRTAQEEILAAIWQSVLRVERVGINDNFFQLGGHSLLATQLVSRMREVFGVEVAVRSLFEQPTVAGLATVLAQSEGIAAPPLVASGRTEAPLSFAQQRLWFLDQLEPNSAFYNMPAAVRLSGPLNVAALERAFTEITRRHETLRTRFVVVAGEARQQITAPAPYALPVIDLTGMAVEMRAAEAERLACVEGATPFDLSAGELLRVKLVRVSAEEHVVLLTMHHIISDGWSLGVLIKEVAALYEAYSEGHESPLEELAIQYGDYALWQREWLQGEVLDQQMQYWREQLAELPVLEIPTDHIRPAVQSYSGKHHYFNISPEVTQQLKDLSQQEGATLFMVLLAAFQLFLSRYSGQEDIVVGTAIAGRSRAGIENLIGCFVNTLVMRTDLSGGPTFQELVKRVREVSLGAYAHQDGPFEKLVEELQPERDLSRSPLFQTMFILQNTPRDTLQLAGLTLSLQQTPGTTAKLDLLLSVVEGADGLVADLEYNTDLFATATVERMCRHFETLLMAVAVEPQQKIARVPMLSAGEQEQILVAWNQTAVEYGPASCVHELFEQHAERTPEATALMFAEQSVSYRELNERANQVAHYLRACGVRAEAPVAVYLPRSIEMVVALLGILKAGGAYVPLDVEYPVERLSFMLADADVSLLLTDSGLTEQLPLVDEVEVINLDQVSEAIGEESKQNLASEVSVENLAYVIYTSGSTGRPKGVMIRHRTVGNMLSGLYRALELGHDEVWTLCHSYAFDFSVWELWGALLSGARLVLIPAGMLRTPHAFRQELQQRKVTVLSLTPSAMGQLLRACEGEQWSAERGWSLRRVVVGGEALSGELRAEVVRRGVAGWNFYGPTEATVWTTIEKLEESGREGGIGKPIGNYEVYVLDGELEPVAVGVSGELYIGGAGLARAYLNRASLTAERFIPHPYSRTEGARLYQTGDVARYLADGRIEYVGRADEQVKVRGYRIELGEIEAVLERQAGVAECVVVVRGEGAEKRLVAYVVAQNGASLSVTELRAQLGEQLPGYMVPGVYVMLPELPLTKNGKVDRRGLPAPEESGMARSEQYVGPRTATEEIVAGVWQSVLKVERVGINDNFFELGGHSLLATQLVSRLREVFAVEVALRSLFERPTVSGLAEVLARSEALSAPPLVASPRTEALPLSFAQQRLWFLDQLEPNSAFYNIPAAVRLSGPLNIAALERTFTEIVRRHEVLRTRFITIDGEARQQIAEPMPFKLPVEDLTAMAEELRSAEAERLARAEAATPFDLSAGELLRVKVLRMAAEQHIVLLTMHHISSDGWSLGVLIKEVGMLYAAYSEGKESPLEELTIQYGDYARWQREWLQGEVLEQQMEYWREQLAELPVLELPTDHVRPAVQSYKGSHHHFTIPQELTQQLKKFSQQEGATLFMVLLAGFQLLLSRYSGQQDIVVGTAIAGRNHTETENLIGFFVNQLVIRTDLSGGPTLSELVKRVREVCLGAYAHQDVPFEKLVEELQPERDLSRSPLVQVAFGLQNAPIAVELPELNVNIVAGESMATPLDFTCLMVESERELKGRIEYNTDLFEAETVARMCRHFQRLLTVLTTGAQQTVACMPMLSDEEQEQILVDWNQTAVEYGQVACVHELFEQQVEQTPEAAALVFAGQSLSYRELNERANQVAHYLRARGVGPEVLVGLCLPRSIEMMVALLGILKAGGAYLPLDAEYPVERLSFMIEDAGVSLLLTGSGLRRRLPVLDGVEVISLDQISEAIGEASKENVASGVSGENLAYVIYTSGSTGQPKGVMIQHAGAVNLAHAQIHAFGITSSDRVLQFASLSFDAAVSEIFITWCAGATLCLATAEQLLPGADFLSLLQAQQISTVTLPPSVLNVLPLTELPALQSLVLAGEKSSLGVVRAWAQAGRSIYNAYGPTEATVCATVSEPIGAAAEEMPIGRPIGNMEVYLLDRELEPVAVGVSGELYIGGAGLARAYLNRAALTAERFIPHPFGRTEGARLYRTGDVARYLADGRIEYVGRADEQVKVRGYRIELGEIEAVLERQAGVAECVVVARGEEGEKRLVAYVVAEAGASLSVTELRTRMGEQLPGYMVPAAFVMLESLPLTKNGKVDRRALPEPEASGLERSEDYVAPRNATEEILTGIWQSVLRVERVGVDDNFFELGGHSLLATQLVSRLREVFAVEIALRSLFEHPTVAALAEVVTQSDELSAPPILASDRTEALPLSFAQQRLWFLDQLEPNSVFYNIPAAVRLSGPLNLAALERTFTEIVRRHEALRTSFITVDGEARQQIAAPATFKLPLIDLTTMPAELRSAEVELLAHAEAAMPFDLSAGELLRVTALRVAAKEHVVLLTMHHIISDGWSMGVLIKEVGALYQAYSEGKESPLEELSIQYGDYARWQREWLQGEVLELQLGYWREQLAELPVLELPTDHVRPAVQSYKGSNYHFTIPRELTQELKEFSQQEGATLFMVLLAAFQLLLSRYSRQEDIVVGTIVAGRNRAETENLIGFFINQLVMRTDLSGGPTFKALVKRVREVCLEAYAHQDVPFEKLVEELQPERDPSRSPLVQVAFGLQNAPEVTLELPELTLTYINPGTDAVRYDLTIWVVEENGSLSFRWTYNTGLFDRSTIERMTAHFEALLHSAVANRDARLTELNMQTDAEIVEETFRESEIEEASISSLISARRRPVVLHHMPVNEASPV